MTRIVAEAHVSSTAIDELLGRALDLRVPIRRTYQLRHLEDRKAIDSQRDTSSLHERW